MYSGKDDMKINEDFPFEVERFINKYISKKIIEDMYIIHTSRNTTNNFLIS